jgi:GGDEF domain-containing protein
MTTVEAEQESGAEPQKETWATSALASELANEAAQRPDTPPAAEASPNATPSATVLEIREGEEDRLMDTPRTREMARAEDSYINKHPLPAADAPEAERTAHKAGRYLAAQNVQTSHDMGGDLLAAPPELRREAADKTFPEGRIELRAAQRAAETDPLTGLGNRAAFDKALKTAEADPNLAIGCFDANNFGRINKKISYKAGDATIVLMADAITAASEKFTQARRVFVAGEGDEGAERPEGSENDERDDYRQGGDEFMVIAPKESIDDIIKEASRLVDERLASDEPLTFEGQQFVTADIRKLKVSLTGVSADTFDEADAKLKAAKGQRKKAEGWRGSVRKGMGHLKGRLSRERQG